MSRRILVGEIGRPHGVRGLVKLRSFTEDPGAIAGYAPLTDSTGARRYDIAFLADGLARIEGVADRDAAARLTGTKLYAARERLPPTGEEEFYLADLVGLAARTEAGETLGRIAAVEDHGGGTFLVVTGEGAQERLLPFTRAVVPVVDIAGGMVVVVPPVEVTVAPPSGEAGEAGDAAA